jgi:ferredoxin-like protein FixX
MIACAEGAIQWSYPKGDFGVQYSMDRRGVMGDR